MTLVIDTSVVVPAITDAGVSGEAARAAMSGDDLIAPALLDIEVTHVLRGRVLGGKLPLPIAEVALAQLEAFPVRRFEAVPLLRRMWQLRGNLTAYDAAYVALAEAFDAPLVTADASLTKASGPACEFRLVAVGG